MKTLITLSDWMGGAALLAQDRNLIRVTRDYYDNPSCCIDVRTRGASKRGLMVVDSVFPKDTPPSQLSFSYSHGERPLRQGPKKPRAYEEDLHRARFISMLCFVTKSWNACMHTLFYEKQ
jgi:hypothetical protein